MNLIHDINFDNYFSFIYSPRPGTPAASLHDDTSMEVKKQRLNILQQRIGLQAARISETMINRQQRILITGPSKKNPDEFSGRTECNRVVNIKANRNIIGQLIDVTITEARPNSLRGLIIH